MTSRSAVIKALALASATFPNYPTTREMIEAYSLLLEDLDISEEQLLTAVGRVLKSQPFFPTVHAIRKEVFETFYVLAPSGASAWQELQRYRELRAEQHRNLDQLPMWSDEWNRYRETYDFISAFDPQWSNRAIGQTVESFGGWSAVYQTLGESKGLLTFRSQFLKAYAEFAEKEDRLTYLGNERKELV